MRVSKLVAGCVLGVVLLCADCGKFEEFAEAPEVDRAVKGGVQSALAKLKGYAPDYMVSTVLDAPGEVRCISRCSVRMGIIQSIQWMRMAILG